MIADTIEWASLRREVLVSRGPSPGPGDSWLRLGLVICVRLSRRKTAFPPQASQLPRGEIPPRLVKTSQITARKQGFLWQLVRIIEMWVEAH